MRTLDFGTRFLKQMSCILGFGEKLMKFKKPQEKNQNAGELNDNTPIYPVDGVISGGVSYDVFPSNPVGDLGGGQSGTSTANSLGNTMSNLGSSLKDTIGSYASKLKDQPPSSVVIKPGICLFLLTLISSRDPRFFLLLIIIWTLIHGIPINRHTAI